MIALTSQIDYDRVKQMLPQTRVDIDTGIIVHGIEIYVNADVPRDEVWIMHGRQLHKIIDIGTAAGNA